MRVIYWCFVFGILYSKLCAVEVICLRLLVLAVITWKMTAAMNCLGFLQGIQPDRTEIAGLFYLHHLLGLKGTCHEWNTCLPSLKSSSEKCCHVGSLATVL